MSPHQSQVGGIDGVQLGRSRQRDRRVRGALRAVEPASGFPAEQQRAVAAEDVTDDSTEVRVDGAVENDVRREVDQQQTVGDLDGRREPEIRLPVSGNRLTQQNKPRTIWIT